MEGHWRPKLIWRTWKNEDLKGYQPKPPIFLSPYHFFVDHSRKRKKLLFRIDPEIGVGWVWQNKIGLEYGQWAHGESASEAIYSEGRRA